MQYFIGTTNKHAPHFGCLRLFAPSLSFPSCFFSAVLCYGVRFSGRRFFQPTPSLLLKRLAWTTKRYAQKDTQNSSFCECASAILCLYQWRTVRVPVQCVFCTSFEHVFYTVSYCTVVHCALLFRITRVRGSVALPTADSVLPAMSRLLWQQAKPSARQ